MKQLVQVYSLSNGSQTCNLQLPEPSYSPSMSVAVCGHWVQLSNIVPMSNSKVIGILPLALEQGPEVDASLDSNSLYHIVIDLVTLQIGNKGLVTPDITVRLV